MLRSGKKRRAYCSLGIKRSLEKRRSRPCCSLGRGRFLRKRSLGSGRLGRGRSLGRGRPVQGRERWPRWYDIMLCILSIFFKDFFFVGEKGARSTSGSCTHGGTVQPPHEPVQRTGPVRKYQAGPCSHARVDGNGHTATQRYPCASTCDRTVTSLVQCHLFQVMSVRKALCPMRRNLL